MRASILVGLAALVSMCAAASADSEDRFRVDGVDYCVPRSAALRDDLWWIPRELPKDGFAFQLHDIELPEWVVAVDLRGKKRSLVGFVVQQNLGQDDSARTVLAQRAGAPGAIIERDEQLDLALVFESSRRDHWTAWRVQAGVEPNADSLSRLGVLVAICSKPAGASRSGWKGPAAVCQRRIAIDRAQVGYSIDAANLPYIVRVDEVVKKHVLSWRCPGQEPVRLR